MLSKLLLELFIVNLQPGLAFSCLKLIFFSLPSFFLDLFDLFLELFFTISKKQVLDSVSLTWRMCATALVTGHNWWGLSLGRQRIDYLLIAVVQSRICILANGFIFYWVKRMCERPFLIHELVTFSSNPDSSFITLHLISCRTELCAVVQQTVCFKSHWTATVPLMLSQEVVSMESMRAFGGWDWWKCKSANIDTTKFAEIKWINLRHVLRDIVIQSWKEIPICTSVQSMRHHVIPFGPLEGAVSSATTVYHFFLLISIDNWLCFMHCFLLGFFDSGRCAHLLFLTFAVTCNIETLVLT